MFLESKSSLISDLNYLQKLALQLEEELGKKNFKIRNNVPKR